MTRIAAFAFGLCGLCVALAAAVPLSVLGQDAEEDPLPTRGAVIDIDAPERSLYRIAVPNLRGGSGLGAQGAEVLRGDFKLVSLFKVLDPASFLANLDQEGMSINPPSWETVGAQGVIKGEINKRGSKVEVKMRLFELARGNKPTLEKTYRGGQGDVRKFMHKFANEVLRVLTGQAGAFGSRITFARRVGPGRKDVYVADFDGHNVGRISSGRGVSMLPSFGPGGIWYSVLSPAGMYITKSGAKDRPIIRGNGLNMGVAPCGGRIVFSSTRDGNAEIYSARPDGSDVRRLTRNKAIDVSPTCGPGGKIAFVSNRHGSPQIWVMDSEGGGAKRVTYKGAHNQTPAWCPDPKRQLLAFTGRESGMDIFTLDLVSGKYTRLTQGQGSNKDPAWSPDCRMVAFASSRGGIYVSNPEGLNQQRIVAGAAETVRWSN